MGKKYFPRKEYHSVAVTTHRPPATTTMSDTTKCQLCAMRFPRGRAMSNHMRGHVLSATSPPSSTEGTDAAVDAGDDDDLDFGEGESQSSEEGAAPRDHSQNFAEYFEHLRDAGTLDLARVLRHMNHAGTKPAQADRQVFEFLAAMFGGRGSSAKQGQRMLRFLRGHSQMSTMPTSIAKCWSVVDAVRHTGPSKVPVQCTFLQSLRHALIVRPSQYHFYKILT